ncbi:YafY family protein [Chishuiella sp.]|uniref:helix-turn-helix transcriptional regulator n=1 Tax=Chishuiella sp. TaxID=1969467 RepID=UPI0028A5FBBC|nr:YafY family protein [Chishuiella sp.]
MSENENKRLTRLTAILTYLQTKRLITAIILAKRFDVSLRTIYRDIKTLEQAGVPILTEDGKGYTLMEGYRMPPIMFTEAEANALVTAEQLILKNRDSSLIQAYTDAIQKIKAVLQFSTKEKVETLSEKVIASPVIPSSITSNSLISIQHALTHFLVLNIEYQSEKDIITSRSIEPFALYFSLEENWTLIAYCRLRKDYRMFRLDRIEFLETSDLHFTPHKITLASYLSEKEKKFRHP